MKKSVKRILMSLMVIVGLVVSVGLGFFANVQAASGYVSDGEASALIECYNNGAFKSPVQGEVFKKSYAVGAEKFMTTHQVYIPIGSTGLFKTDPAKTKAACPELVDKLLKDKNISVPGPGSTGEEITTFMESLGYTNVFDTTKKIRCFQFKYTVNVSGIGNYNGVPQLTKSICAEIEGGSEENGYNDGVMVGTLSVQNNGNTYLDQLFDPIVVLNGDLEIRYLNEGILFQSPKLIRSYSYEANNTKWGDFKEKIKDDVLTLDLGNERSPAKGSFKRYPGDITVEYDIALNNGSVDIANGDLKNVETAANYKIDSNSVEAKHAGTTTLVGQRLDTKPQFTDDEIASLYSAYLKDFYGAETKFELSEDEVKKGKYVETKSCKDGKMKKAYTRATKNKEELVGGVDNNDIFGIGVNFKQIAEWLKNSDEEECPEESNPEPGPNPDDPNKSKDIVDCNDLKTIGAMQWVLCPAMNGMQYSANALDKWTEEQLSVNTKLFDMNNSGEGRAGHRVYKAWGYIRNIANVLMIVFLLIIIFSQLTGRGIDNYGIKKMLPRLIVMAIVVNLSYYICELAIDLSNIFGVGLRDMFGATGNAVAPVDGLSYVGGMIAGAFATMITASGAPIATAARVGIALAGITGPVIAIVLAVMVALLLIIVAIFVLFIMLGIRQILIVVCLLLSPLAFVAYILPNTQNLFKSWWNLFKACLIIFPLCGAFSGISYLLKSTVGNSTSLGVPGSLVMMVLPYVIFFLLPMLLKSAIAALGKIGGALTALGGTVKSGAQSWGRAATGVAKNTEAYKNRQLEIAKRRQAKSADRTIAKLGEIEEKNLSPEEKLRLARAHETKRKLAQEDTAAETILMEKKYAGMSETALLKGLRTAIDNGDAGNVKALSNVLVSRGGNGAINKIGNMIGETEFFDKEGEFVGGDNGAMARSFNALRENLQENKTLNTGTLNKTSDVYQMLTGGGYDAEGEHRYNLYYHSKHNDLTTQAKDLATQSSDTIRRAIAGGGMSPELFNSVLTSEDPAIQSGILSEDSKANLLKAGSMGYAGDLSDAKAVAASAAKYDLAHPDASSVKFTGKQLADYSVDELRTLANRAINDGVGSEAYKKFVAASNEIAQSPELLTNLSADKKAEIHRVRIANNSNDRVFANNTEMNIDHRGNGADFISE